MNQSKMNIHNTFLLMLLERKDLSENFRFNISYFMKSGPVFDVELYIIQIEYLTIGTQ